MDHHVQKLSEHLYWLEDTCNVFVVKKEDRAVLIDFGSGHVLDHLDTIGVRHVLGVLHTHHHRDQAQGDMKAVERGIPIYVPAHERHMFDQAEIYWSTKQLYDMYNVRNTYFSLGTSIPVTDVLTDYSEIELAGVVFRILPTPGHTVGSVSLVAEIDGRTIAFSGDLLYAPGKVQTLYDLQYNYGSVDGIEATILALGRLEDVGPHLVCPSHGAPMEDANTALAETKSNLRNFYRLQSGGQLAADEIDFIPVASRVLFASQNCSSFYVILSRNGRRALFVDYGAPNFSMFQPANMHFEPGERARFMHHSLDRLKTQYGIEEIEAVIPSHYHDDHINGVPYLQQQHGTAVWAYENMKEILEHPEGELIGCIFPDPVRVERTFADEERFSWEGIDFDIHYTPGHCDYHMAMFTNIDGKKIAFSGDNVWPPNFVPSLIYRNHVHRTSHQITAALYSEYRPEVLCSGHGLFTNVAPEGYDMFLSNAERLTELFDDLLPESSGLTGIEPSWFQIYPYQSPGSPGDTIHYEIRVKNPLEMEASLEYRWKLPVGWSADPNGGAASLASGESIRQKAAVTIGESYEFMTPKQLITCDVTLNGKVLGELAEAVVEHKPYGPSGARR